VPPPPVTATETEVLAGPKALLINDVPAPAATDLIVNVAPAKVPDADSATSLDPVAPTIYRVHQLGNVTVATSAGVPVVKTVAFLMASMNGAVEVGAPPDGPPKAFENEVLMSRLQRKRRLCRTLI